MAPYTQTRNSPPVAAKVVLLLLGAVSLILFIFPTELLSAACAWMHHPLSSRSQETLHLTPWSFRGLGSGRVGDVGAKVDDDGDDKKKQKVQLEIHIMSKCPDAKDCMEQLVFPALEQLGPDIVDFKMSFIGKTSTGNGGVACMHGPGECLGNMVHLCGAKLYPYNGTAENQTTTFIPFSKCLIHDYKNLPNQTFIEGCAREGKVDFEEINQCVSDTGFEGGIELLRSSFDWSEYLGVRTSCTVRLAGKRRCVRDGGKWRDCEGGSRVEDLVRDVKAEHDRTGKDALVEFEGGQDGGDFEYSEYIETYQRYLLELQADQE